MEDKPLRIELKCLFCDCPLEGDADKEHSSGDMIECKSCHEQNDYDALIDVAAEEGREMAKNYAEAEIQKMLNKAMKK